MRRTPRSIDPRAVGLLTLGLLGPSASAQTLLDTWYGSLADDHSGTCVTTVGDMDGDGLHDIAVGAPDADRFVAWPIPALYADVGSVTVRSGLDGTVIRTFYGSATSPSEFGTCIADAGDVNGDGLDELLIGAPAGDGFATDSGIVQLFDGATGQLLHTFAGTQTAERYGESFCVGEMDGDPSSLEISIGSPDYDTDDSLGGHQEEGRVTTARLVDGVIVDILHGGEIVLFPYVLDQAGLGRRLAYLGDLDETGLGYVLIGAPETDEGIFDLPDVGMLRVYSPISSGPNGGSFWSGGSGSRLGAVVSGPGPDPAAPGPRTVAAASSSSDELIVFTEGVATTWPAVNLAACATLGVVGDLTGDGQQDIAAGLPGLGLGPGRVDVYSAGQFSATLTGPPGALLFGAGVSGLDRDGDGRSELFVGAPYDDVTPAGAGSVTIYTDVACWQALSGPYGAGLAGTLGVPSLEAIGDPELGSTIQLAIGNAAGEATLAYGFVGFSTASVPVKGGTLLVDPLQIAAFALPSGGLNLPLVVPDDPNLCGIGLYLQVLHADDGASHGAAYSKGLRLRFGD